VIRDQILEPDSMRTLAKMIEEELQSDRDRANERAAAVESEFRDVEARLGRLYDALETGRLSMDDLAPRIKATRERQEALLLAKSRIGPHCPAAAKSENEFDLTPEDLIDLRGILDKGSPADRREFIRSLVSEIEVGASTAAVKYTARSKGGLLQERGRLVMVVQ